MNKLYLGTFLWFIKLEKRKKKNNVKKKILLRNVKRKDCKN